MTRVNKPATYRDLGAFDVTDLAALVSSLPDSLWAIEDQRKENNFSVFHHTQHIIFRFTPGNRDHTEFYTNPIWAIWQDRLLPLMDAITAQYGNAETVYSKVMLARLLSGQSIDRHVDGAGANLHTHKVHVPLVSGPSAVFTIEGEERHLEVGRAYEVNNVARHSARNDEKFHRIHLIFEHYDAES